MSSQIIVGPLLGFEDGEIYTVCALLSTDAPPPVLHLSSQPAPIDFTRVTNVGPHVFWRAEFTVSVPPDTGANVSYHLALDGTSANDAHGRTTWAFYVPAANEQPLISYASCNGFSSADLLRDTDEPYALWQKMAEQHSARPFALLLMGGDQVYADELWESARCPLLRAWSKLSWKQQHAVEVSSAMATEIAAFYDALYPDRWLDKSMSLMFASIPSVMMWDDHDIFDGWGSYPAERLNCPVFHAVFTEAARLFDMLQLRGGTRNHLNPGAAHRTLRLRFRDYHILALDNRSERTLDRIMSDSHWREVKTWLAGFDGQPLANLLVLTGVPAAYRSFSAVEAVMDHTPWHEELEDDVHDHWSSRSHEAERMRLIMVLLDFLAAQKRLRGVGSTAPACKAVLLSGDVHVGALGQIWCERQELGLTQIISSGIVHPPPSAFAWAGIQLMTSDRPESLGDGEVIAEMLTPLGAPRYLRTRNFATIQTGTDAKIWVNWICENPKWHPSFAIA
jgi:PhoD related phosphatase